MHEGEQIPFYLDRTVAMVANNAPNVKLVPQPQQMPIVPVQAAMPPPPPQQQPKPFIGKLFYIFWLLTPGQRLGNARMDDDNKMLNVLLIYLIQRTT